MTNQPPDPERSFRPQFPNTPEAREARRQLQGWTELYRREAEVQRERDALREQLRLLEQERAALQALIREQANGVLETNKAATEMLRTINRLLDQLREKDDLIHELQREQRNHEFGQPEQIVLPEMPEEDQTAKRSVRRGPLRAAWRTWVGFRDDMRKRERVLRDVRKKSGIKVPIELADLAGGAGGDSLKTIERTMEFYGLDPDTAGLPSTWPDQDPRTIAPGHHLAAVIAAMFLFVIADLVYGRGPVDSIRH